MIPGQEQIVSLGSLAGALVAIATAVVLAAKYILIRPLDRRIRELTKPIQPDANGGKSLPDISGKVDELRNQHQEVLERLSALEGQMEVVVSHITSRAPRRRPARGKEE